MRLRWLTVNFFFFFNVQFTLLSLVQEGETCPGASTAGERCERGSSTPAGCYPALPDADGASVISQPDTSRVLPDAIAPSLACTPEFARRASWSHAIEVSGYFYLFMY